MQQGQSNLSTETPFDNATIRKLRTSFAFGIPARFIWQGESVFDRIRDELPTSSPSTLMQNLKRKYPNLSDEDLLFSILGEMQKGKGAISPQEQLRIANSLSNDVFNRYSSHAFLLDQMGQWRERVQREFQNQTVIPLTKIGEYISELEKTSPVRCTDLELRSVTISRKVFVQDKTPEPADYFEAFAMANLSEVIPYVEVINGEQKLFKVYNGQDPASSDRISPELYLPADERQSEQGNRLAFVLWMGSGPDERRDHNTYVMGRIFLATNQLQITFPPTSERQLNLYFDKISEALPCLNFGEQRYSEVAGSFNILDIEQGESVFRVASFLYLILVDPVLSTYLYSSERARTTAEKKRLIVHFRTEPMELGPSYGDITVSLTGRISNQALEMTMMEEDLTTLELSRRQEVIPASTPYLTVSVTRAENLNVIRQFIRTFTRLIQLYMEKEKNTYDLYTEYFPNAVFPPIWEDASLEQEAVQDGDNIPMRQRRRIFRLRSAAEDVFVTEYARLCQAAYQPEPIPASQVEQYRAQTFTDNGETVNRQVMEFPRPQDQKERGQPPVFLVCLNPEYPYPGMKVNRRTPNRDRYPYMPCCTKSDQMSPGIDSYYHDYMEGKVPQVKTKVEATLSDPGTLTKTDKIAEPGRIGSSPQQIREFLQAIGMEVKDLVRYGVVRDRLSVIHCLMTIFDERYRQTLDIAERQDMARQFMKRAAQRIPPASLRQEMFDMSDLQIRNRIQDTQIFADPRVLHRFLEEAFNVNLYIFIREKEEVRILLPRHRVAYFHHFRRERPIVILYQHMGAESDFLEYPQVEIIMDFANWDRKLPQVRGKEQRTLSLDVKARRAGEEGDQPAMTFPAKPVGVQMERLIQFTQSVKVWNPDMENATSMSKPRIPKNATAQFIDANGKMRGLTYSINGQSAWVLTPPMAPRLLPGVEYGPDSFKLCSLETAFLLLGEGNNPTSYDVVDEQVVGVWFHEIYIPTTPAPAHSRHSPRGKRMNFTPALSSGPIRESILNRRTVELLLQVVWWLFTLHLIRGDNNVDAFFARYTRISDDPSPIPLRRALSRLPVVFPSADTPEGGILSLRDLCREAFTPHGQAPALILPTLKLREALALRLREHLRNIGRFEIQVPKSIVNRYMYSFEIPVNTHEVAFANFDTFARWVETHDSAGIKPVETHLDEGEIRRDVRYQTESPFAILPEDPTLYQSKEGNLYLLHPRIQRDAFSRWVREGINPDPQIGPVQKPDLIVEPDATGRITFPDEVTSGDAFAVVEVARQAFGVLPLRI